MDLDKVGRAQNTMAKNGLAKNGLPKNGQMRMAKMEWPKTVSAHLSCRMCNQFTFHIKNSGLILGGQNLSNRQTIFFLPVDPMDKNHKDPDSIDLTAPRHA